MSTDHATTTSPSDADAPGDPGDPDGPGAHGAADASRASTTAKSASTSPPERPDRWGRRLHMKYGQAWTWLILVSALDVMLTWTILHLGGAEVNTFAAAVIEWGGLPATLAYKFALVVVAIVVCEEVGRRSDRWGHGLSRLLVVIGCVPLIVAAVQLVLWAG